jgi:chromosome segregation protein
VAERAALEADLGVEALREQLLVDLAALGEIALRHLPPISTSRHPDGEEPAESGPAEVADQSDAALFADEDRERSVLVQRLEAATQAWSMEPPSSDAPGSSRLAQLRRRLAELGSANPYAVAEYGEVKARLDELERQRADLAQAIERTRQLIAELSRLIVDQFGTTFRALESAFDERFQQLFGGGFARLELTDPDSLGSTGVEITARPPGKRRQPLAMLSGGERSLTAVALLLAMLQVRPVPFCVLDEVDAALDEANVGRFTSALRDLAERTQFIVITHNRGTIRIADALYGVTVGDDSVSRVISLRLDEADAIAARRRAGAAGSPANPAV